MSSPLQTSSSIWYKEPYVWLLILFPLTAVVGGMITIRLAILSNDGLVSDDYYKQGLAINQKLERDKAALTHQLQAALSWDVQRGKITLSLQARPDYLLPLEVNLVFHHRTQTGFDQTQLLTRFDERQYSGTLPHLPVGLWQIELNADDWRLTKAITWPHTLSTIILQAN